MVLQAWLLLTGTTVLVMLIFTICEASGLFPIDVGTGKAPIRINPKPLICKRATGSAGIFEVGQECPVEPLNQGRQSWHAGTSLRRCTIKQAVNCHGDNICMTSSVELGNLVSVFLATRYQLTAPSAG
jgi:hypothetical protein